MKQRQILVGSSILESVAINIEELRFHLVELKSILGPKFEQLIPDNINDFATLSSYRATRVLSEGTMRIV